MQCPLIVIRFISAELSVLFDAIACLLSMRREGVRLPAFLRSRSSSISLYTWRQLLGKVNIDRNHNERDREASERCGAGDIAMRQLRQIRCSSCVFMALCCAPLKAYIYNGSDRRHFDKIHCPDLIRGLLWNYQAPLPQILSCAGAVIVYLLYVSYTLAWLSITRQMASEYLKTLLRLQYRFQFLLFLK